MPCLLHRRELRIGFSARNTSREAQQNNTSWKSCTLTSSMRIRNSIADVSGIIRRLYNTVSQVRLNNLNRRWLTGAIYQIKMSYRNNGILSLCALLAVNLHLIIFIVSAGTDLPWVIDILAHAATAPVWIQVYLYLTGETRLHVFLNWGINLAAPLVAVYLHRIAGQSLGV